MTDSLPSFGWPALLISPLDDDGFSVELGRPLRNTSGHLEPNAEAELRQHADSIQAIISAMKGVLSVAQLDHEDGIKLQVAINRLSLSGGGASPLRERVLGRLLEYMKIKAGRSQAKLTFPTKRNSMSSWIVIS